MLPNIEIENAWALRQLAAIILRLVCDFAFQERQYDGFGNSAFIFAFRSPGYASYLDVLKFDHQEFAHVAAIVGFTALRQVAAVLSQGKLTLGNVLSHCAILGQCG